MSEPCRIVEGNAAYRPYCSVHDRAFDVTDCGAGRAVQDDGRTFEQAVWRAIQSYPGTIEIDNAQRFREHLWGRVNASESPPTDGGEEAHERGHLLGLGDASESGQPPGGQR